MSKEIEEEIERIESLGMKPFSLLEKHLMMQGYNVAKQEIEKLRIGEKQLLETINVLGNDYKVKIEKQRLKKIEYKKSYEVCKERYEKLRKENEELRGRINKMFLELGSKWHDNEITITNPQLFIKSWKRELLTKKG